MVRHLIAGTALAATLLTIGPAIATAQDAAVRLVNDTEADEFVISIGPIDLPASAHGGHDMAAMGDMAQDAAGGEGGGGGGDHHGAMFLPPVDEVTIPVDAYLYGFRYTLRDAEGNEVPSELLHHLNVIDPDHRDLFLPISYRVAAVGSETGPMKLPWLLFGQPVKAGQRLVISAMLHNPTPTDYHGVTVDFVFQYVKGGRPWPLLSVYSFQMDVAFPAGDKDFDLPPGRTTRAWEGSPSIDGRIVAIGGHLHDHAVELMLEDVTAGDTLWEGEPIYDEDSTLVGVTIGRLYRRFGVRIHADHVYRVSVTYDNPTQDTIPAGGMGLVAGLFVPGVDQWPAADPANELYALDRQHYMREVRGPLDEITADSTGMQQMDDGGHGDHRHEGGTQ